VVLLSRKLPDGVELPAVSYELFLSVCEDVIKSQQSSYIWDLWSLISGACHDVPSLVPFQVSEELRQQLARIVKSGGHFEEQHMLLVCLAILSQFPPISGDHENLASAFFSGGGAGKSLTLATVHAAYHCRPTEESISVSSQILDCTITVFRKCQQVLDMWTKSEKGARNIQRIRNKCANRHININLRLKAFHLLALTDSLAESQSDSMEFQKLLAARDEIDLEDQGGEEALRFIVQIHGPFIGHEAIGSIFNSAASCVENASDAQSFTKIRTLQALLTGFQMSRRIRKNSEDPIATSFKSAGYGSLDCFICWRPVYSPCGLTKGCGCTIQDAKRRLTLSVLSLALTSLPGRSTADLPVGALVAGVIELSTLLGQCPGKSAHRKAQHRTNQLTDDSPDTGNCLQTVSWHHRIEQFVSLDSEKRATAIRLLFDQLCNDLAHSDIPLQEERKRTNALEAQSNALGKEVQRLNAEVLDRDVIIGTIEEQKMDASQGVAQIRQENEILLDKVSSIQSQLQKASMDAGNRIAELEQDLDRASLANLAANEARDALIIAHADDLRRVSRTLDQERENMNIEKAAFQAVDQTRKELLISLELCRERLGREKTEKLAAQADLSRMEMELNAAAASLSSEIKGHSDIQTQFLDLRDAFEVARNSWAEKEKQLNDASKIAMSQANEEVRFFSKASLAPEADITADETKRIGFLYAARIGV
jgi:hypothetical protein